MKCRFKSEFLRKIVCCRRLHACIAFRRPCKTTYDGVKKNACLKLSEVNQDVVSAAAGTIIFPVANKWGKQGWTTIELDKVGDELFIEALTAAYQHVTGKSSLFSSNRLDQEPDC